MPCEVPDFTRHFYVFDEHSRKGGKRSGLVLLFALILKGGCFDERFDDGSRSWSDGTIAVL